MYFTRLAIITVKIDSFDSTEVVVEQTEFAKPANVTASKRQATQYHEKLSNAVSLLTE